jgi:hypothetical protein
MDPDLPPTGRRRPGNHNLLRTEAQEQIGRALQIDRVSPHIRDVLLDGSCEVIDALIKH